jgi:NADH-quinone oxidoreductase subunit H
VILLSGTMSLQGIVDKQTGSILNWNIFGGAGPGFQHLLATLVMVPMMAIFFISALAETNRPPFDLPEAESELVAGYQVEYSSSPFLLYMIGELANIILMCAMISVMFFGGWHAPWPEDYLATWPATLASFHGFFILFAKIIFWFFMFAMVKAIVPRYRYDQLMRLGWKVFLPTSLAAVAIVGGLKVYGVLG